MAQSTDFIYHNIELYKSESLGSGSYGGVCKAKCDGLLCAAKIMHPTLFDLRDPGTETYLRKFQEECHLLSLARHPNIVQYLATYHDPDTQLPVLLMELCDESLTNFLKRSPGPLSYHIQLNICDDISLALVYLHSNGLIHRDLTGNNVLMIAGPRAKITDFGMSKLATVNPRMSALTQCPGNALYMPPEALEASESYTAKLDIFSFGVIVIQILTRLFPNPTDCFRSVHVPQFEDSLRQKISETKRREAHIKLIPETHSLKCLTLQCLKKKKERRPSALELSERLSELKQSSQYTESLHQSQSSNSDIQLLQQQLQGQSILPEAKAREAMEHQIKITELQSRLDDNESQLQEYQRAIASRDHAVEMKERELQQKKEELSASEQLVSEFQECLQQRDETISYLQEIISDHERKSEQLEQLDTASGDLPQRWQELPVTIQYDTVTLAGKDISRMPWREGKNAPDRMVRGAAVVYGNTAYFTSGISHRVYSYQNIYGNERWSQLPDNTNGNFGLVVIHGLLTSVGGCSKGSYMNTLLSLTGEGERKQWFEVLPPMPTPRRNTACVSTNQAVIVAGGDAGDPVNAVEVMNISTKQWTAVSSLPKKLSLLSATVCGDTLCLVGGITAGYNPVFISSIPTLLPVSTRGAKLRQKLSRSNNIWKEIRSLPVAQSTLTSFNGDLLAVGGRSDSGKSTTNVYRYDSHLNLWNIVNQMKNRRSECLAVTLPEDHLIVVGGYTDTQSIHATTSIEILK